MKKQKNIFFYLFCYILLQSSYVLWSIESILRFFPSFTQSSQNAMCNQMFLFIRIFCFLSFLSQCFFLYFAHENKIVVLVSPFMKKKQKKLQMKILWNFLNWKKNYSKMKEKMNKSNILFMLWLQLLQKRITFNSTIVYSCEKNKYNGIQCTTSKHTKYWKTKSRKWSYAFVYEHVSQFCVCIWVQQFILCMF